MSKAGAQRSAGAGASGAQRVDVALVARGHFDSRAQAQAAIAAGLVTAGGKPVTRPATPVSAEIELLAAAPHPYVSRGGVKLAAALDRFNIAPAQRVCLDVGASTGGFTDVLVRRGARRVYAVDVGHGQLHARLRGDARVVDMERRDARTLVPGDFDEAPSLVAFDTSFISLRLVLAPVLALAAPGAVCIALVKPQFEVGRAALSKGIVRDAAARERACDSIAAVLAGLGWRVVGAMESPIAGGDGNREFLIGATR